MPLADAIIDIADAMEKEAGEKSRDSGVALALRVYAGQLRIAVKASGGTGPTGQSSFNPAVATGQHITEIEKARAEFAGKVKKLGEEEQQGQMIEVVGGPVDGTLLPAPGNLSPGMKTAIDGNVYVLSADHKAVFSEVETKKLARKIAGKEVL